MIIDFLYQIKVAIMAIFFYDYLKIVKINSCREGKLLNSGRKNSGMITISLLSKYHDRN